MISKIHLGDAKEILATMDDGSAQTCVTSPPYFGLRDYGHEGQLGLEPTPEEYVANMVDVFREVRRVLRDDGTLWLNIGDSYAGTGKSGGGDQGKRWEGSGPRLSGARGGRWAPPPAGLARKELIGIPWMLAFALRADGWRIRQEIIWHKPNPMPESVRDRCTKAHEQLFLLTKGPSYYFDAEAIKEDADPKNHRSSSGVRRTAPGSSRHSGPASGRRDYVKKNKRSVWSVPTRPFKGAHFAVFPPALIEPCILAGAPPEGVVLDPFAGSGTTGVTALNLGREFVGIEINPEYHAMATEHVGAAERGKDQE